MGENESDSSDLAQQSSALLVVVEPFADIYAMHMDLSSRLTLDFSPSTVQWTSVQYNNLVPMPVQLPK